jgi:hypothetical protein
MSNHVKCPACYAIVNEMELVDDPVCIKGADMTLEEDEPPLVHCPCCDHGMLAGDWQVNVFWMPPTVVPRRVFARRARANDVAATLVQRLLFE